MNKKLYKSSYHKWQGRVEMGNTEKIKYHNPLTKSFCQYSDAIDEQTMTDTVTKIKHN